MKLQSPTTIGNLTATGFIYLFTYYTFQRTFDFHSRRGISAYYEHGLMGSDKLWWIRPYVIRLILLLVAEKNILHILTEESWPQLLIVDRTSEICSRNCFRSAEPQQELNPTSWQLINQHAHCLPFFIGLIYIIENSFLFGILILLHFRENLSEPWIGDRWISGWETGRSHIPLDCITQQAPQPVDHEPDRHLNLLVHDFITLIAEFRYNLSTKYKIIPLSSMYDIVTQPYKKIQKNICLVL